MTSRLHPEEKPLEPETKMRSHISVDQPPTGRHIKQIAAFKISRTRACGDGSASLGKMTHGLVWRRGGTWLIWTLPCWKCCRAAGRQTDLLCLALGFLFLYLPGAVPLTRGQETPISTPLPHHCHTRTLCTLCGSVTKYTTTGRDEVHIIRKIFSTWNLG